MILLKVTQFKWKLDFCTNPNAYCNVFHLHVIFKDVSPRDISFKFFPYGKVDCCHISGLTTIEIKCCL